MPRYFIKKNPPFVPWPNLAEFHDSVPDEKVDEILDEALERIHAIFGDDGSRYEEISRAEFAGWSDIVPGHVRIGFPKAREK